MQLCDVQFPFKRWRIAVFSPSTKSFQVDIPRVGVETVKDLEGKTLIKCAGSNTDLEDWTYEDNEWAWDQIDGSVESLNGFLLLITEELDKRDCESLISTLVQNNPEALWTIIKALKRRTIAFREALSECSAFACLLDHRGVTVEWLATLLEHGLCLNEIDSFHFVKHPNRFDTTWPSVMQQICLAGLSSEQCQRCIALLLWEGAEVHLYLTQRVDDAIEQAAKSKAEWTQQVRQWNNPADVCRLTAAQWNSLMNCHGFAIEELRDCHENVDQFFSSRWSSPLISLMWSYLPNVEMLDIVYSCCNCDGILEEQMIRSCEICGSTFCDSCFRLKCPECWHINVWDSDNEEDFTFPEL